MRTAREGNVQRRFGRLADGMKYEAARGGADIHGETRA